jgi:ankyrin repeat protein
MTQDFEKAIIQNKETYILQQLGSDRPFPVNARDKNLQSGLMLACKHNSIKVVKMFLEQSTTVESDDPSFCNVNLADASGWTALHYATKQGSLECVKLLIEHNAEIDTATDKNEAAIFLATKHNHPDIVEFLTENNCHLQAKALYKKKPEKYSWETQKEEDFTALEVAVQHNFVETAKCLLFHLIRRNKLNEEQLNEVLLKAVEEGHTKIAHELIINGAELNYVTYSPGIILNYHKILNFK